MTKAETIIQLNALRHYYAERIGMTDRITEEYARCAKALGIAVIAVSQTEARNIDSDDFNVTATGD